MITNDSISYNSRNDNSFNKNLLVVGRYNLNRQYRININAKNGLFNNKTQF